MVKTFFLWLGQRAAGFWLVSAFGTAALTYMAVAAEILVEYAPFSYGVVALASFLVICFGLALYGWGLGKYQMARFVQRRSEVTPINPLDDTFERKRIKVIDFYHPYFKTTKRARFKKCELYGPADIFAKGCTFDHVVFIDCDTVIANSTATSRTVTVFEECVFEDCHLYRLLLIFTASQYQQIVDLGLAGGLNLISGDAQHGDG